MRAGRIGRDFYYLRAVVLFALAFVVVALREMFTLRFLLGAGRRWVRPDDGSVAGGE